MTTNEATSKLANTDRQQMASTAHRFKRAQQWLRNTRRRYDAVANPNSTGESSHSALILALDGVIETGTAWAACADNPSPAATLRAVARWTAERDALVLADARGSDDTEYEDYDVQAWFQEDPYLPPTNQDHYNRMIERREYRMLRESGIPARY
jgi:hypothetical protein